MGLETGGSSPLKMLEHLIAAGFPCLFLDFMHKVARLSVYFEAAKARGTCWMVYRVSTLTGRVIRGGWTTELLSDHHEIHQEDD